MEVQKSFKNSKQTLYIIPTPIGNLEDITIRTLNTLKELDVLYCEDTRLTRKLLNRYEIQITTKAYHEHNKDKGNSDVLRDLESGIDVGLVSDAGMPGISDPGYELIKVVSDAGYNVVVLPGASAFLVALIRSNFPNNEFKYLGFLGTNKRQKEEKLKALVNDNVTSIFYESPHKLLNTLKKLVELDEKRVVTVARELTKLNEEYVKGTTVDVLEHFTENTIKGEFVIVVEPHPEQEVEFDISIEEHVNHLISAGTTKKEAIKMVAKARKMKKNDVYKLFID